ncbi:hypothetical protein J7L09_01665 [bacterium]|nr:hypothetical protein [bacterium]
MEQKTITISKKIAKTFQIKQGPRAGHSFTLYLIYDKDNQIYQTDDKSYADSLKVGDTVKVYYNRVVSKDGKFVNLKLVPPDSKTLIFQKILEGLREIWETNQSILSELKEIKQNLKKHG